MKNPFFYCLVFVSLISVTADCNAASVEEFQRYISDPKALRVVAQICVPDKTAYFDDMTVDMTDLPANISVLALRKLFQAAEAYKPREEFINPYRSNSPIREYQTIRLWRKPVNPDDYSRYWIGSSNATNVKGIVSAGSGSEYLTDSSEKNQPVFLANFYQRPEDIIAVSVMPPKDEHGELREYWFKLPKEISKDKYTKWISPVSEESMNQRSATTPTFWLLTHGRDMPIYEVKENAPKIRYILMNLGEYDKYREYGRRAINSAKLQYMKNNPSSNEDLHYVPAKRESIPPC